MRHEHEDEDDEDPEGGRGGRSSRGEAAGREGRDGGTREQQCRAQPPAVPLGRPHDSKMLSLL